MFTKSVWNLRRQFMKNTGDMKIETENSKIIASRPDSDSGATSKCKLVLLGEAAVGKSSLVLRFVRHNFHEPEVRFLFLFLKFLIFCLFDELF